MKYFVLGDVSLIHHAHKTFGKAEIAIYSDEIAHNYPAKTLISYDDAVSNELNIESEGMISLDSKFLKDMRECEAVFLKMSDRLMPNAGYQQRKDLYLKYLKTWNNLIANEFDFAIFHNVPHECFDYVIYKICELKKIKTFCFYTLPIRPNKNEVYMHMITDIENPDLDITKIYKSPQVLNNFKKALSDKKNLNPHTMMEYYDECLLPVDNFSQFTRSEGNDLSRIKIIFDLPRKTLRYLDQHGYKKILSRITTFLKNHFFYDVYFLSHRQYNKLYQQNTITPNYKKKYIYFPLHYQPEASTSPLCGPFVDQWLIIDMLSNAVDADTEIYIKDHPRQGNILKTNSFFNNILSKNNVSLIDYEESSLNLIRNSFAVATGTGSAGIEAMLNLKPVFMFGNRVYQHGPGVYLIETNSDLQLALTEANTHPHSIKDVELFTKALDLCVFPGFLSQKDANLSSLNQDQVAKNCIEKVHENLLKFRDG